MIICHSCQEVFENHHDLAFHLDRNKGTHKLSYGTRKWIAKMLAINTLSAKARRDIPKRIAPNPDKERTEYGNENREQAVKVLSGETEFVNTHCPNCNKGARQLLPAEYINEPIVWRNQIGLLMVNCPSCRR